MLESDRDAATRGALPRLRGRLGRNPGALPRFRLRRAYGATGVRGRKGVATRAEYWSTGSASSHFLRFLRLFAAISELGSHARLRASRC